MKSSLQHENANYVACNPTVIGLVMKQRKSAQSIAENHEVPKKAKRIHGASTFDAILRPGRVDADLLVADFCCPITSRLMREPVNTSDGHTYEHEAIEKWLETHDTSPLTGLPLENKTLTPVVLVRNSIERLLQAHPQIRDSKEWYLPQSWIMALESACWEGDEAAFRELVNRDRRLLVHTFDEGVHEGKTALQLVLEGGSKPTTMLEVVLELLECREKGLSKAVLLNPNAQGLLPLHQAIESDSNFMLVPTLLTAMEKLSCLDSVVAPHDWPPVAPQTATLCRKTRVADNCRDVLGESLHSYVDQSDFPKVACLLRLRANPNFVFGVSVLTLAFQRAVHRTKRANCFEAVNLLLEAKANPNTPGVLYYALRHKMDHAVVELRRAGATLSTRLDDGTIPLHWAAGQMNTQMADNLWPNGANLALDDLEVPCDGTGNTALHYAAQAGSVEMLHWLLDKGANVTVENAQKQTILHLAAQHNHKQFAEAVLDSGGGNLLDAVDNAGNTPLHLAARAGSMDVVTWLLELGAAISMNLAGKRPRDILPRSKAAAYDKTQAMVKEREDSVLAQQGTMGALLLKQQRLIEAQQAQLEQQKQDLKRLRDQASAEQLLEHMARREHKEAEALMNENPALLYCKSRVNDLSRNRNFTNITALQYAVSTLDWTMWKTILQHLPNKEAKLQYRELEESHGGRQLDWQSVKTALSAKGKTGDRVCESFLINGSIALVWKFIQSFPFILAPFIESVEAEGNEHVITFANGEQERVLMGQKNQKGTHFTLHYAVVESDQTTCNKSLLLLPVRDRRQVLMQFSSRFVNVISLDGLIEEQQKMHQFFEALQSALDRASDP